MDCLDLQIFLHVVDLRLRELLSWSRDDKHSCLVITINMVDPRFCFPFIEKYGGLENFFFARFC